MSGGDPRGCHGTPSRPVEIDLVEINVSQLVDDGPQDGSALANLVLTLRLSASNVVRAAERLVDPGDDAAQTSILLSGWLDELAQAIEARLLDLDSTLR